MFSQETCVQMLSVLAGRGVFTFHWPGLCRSQVLTITLTGLTGHLTQPLTFFYPRPGLTAWSGLSDSGWCYFDWSRRPLLQNIPCFILRSPWHHVYKCIIEGRLTKQSHQAHLGIAGGINNSFPGCSCNQNDFLWQLGIMINDPDPFLSAFRPLIGQEVTFLASYWSAGRTIGKTIECCMQTKTRMNNDL